MTQAAVIGHVAVLPTLLAILMMFFLSYLLRINDPPTPGVGIRTARMLANPALRRKAELRSSRLLVRSGIIFLALTIVAEVFLPDVIVAVVLAVASLTTVVGVVLISSRMKE